MKITDIQEQIEHIKNNVKLKEDLTWLYGLIEDGFIVLEIELDEEENYYEYHQKDVHSYTYSEDIDGLIEEIKYDFNINLSENQKKVKGIIWNV